MTRIFIDGFENGTISAELGWINSGSSINSAAHAGLKGAYSVQIFDNNTLYLVLPTSHSALYLAFKANIYDDNKLGFFHFKDSAGTTTAFLTNEDGLLHLHIGAYSTAIVASGTHPLLQDGTYLIEIYYEPLNSTGEIIVKIGGVTDISYSGDTTAGLENVQLLYWGKVSGMSTGSSLGIHLDDVIIDDANWIGNTYIQAIVPTGAGTTTDFTPSTGANYTCVDEIPAVDTDYVSTNTTGHIDTYATSDLTGFVGNVKTVQLESRIAYEGTPTPTHIQLGCRSNGVDYFATDKSPALSFGRVSKLLLVDPNGDDPWTIARVNQLEIGIKATA
jgi:hypothetical protein